MEAFTDEIETKNTRAVKGIIRKKRKLWSSHRVLGSQLEGCGFVPRPMLDGSGVKAMPGLIPTPNSGSLQKKKRIQVAKWGPPKNIFKELWTYSLILQVIR